MAVDWSTLNLELVADIVLKVETFQDFINFSAVCRSWNRASSSIKHLWRAKPIAPWLLLAENTQDNPDCVRKIFNLNENKIYSLNLPETFGTRCWGSAYGWVALVDRNFDIQLFNPITKDCLSFPNVGLLHTNKDDETDVGEDYISWFLIAFVSRLTVIKVSLNGQSEYVIVVIYDNYEDRRSLAFARHGDQSWTTISLEEIGETMVVDMVAMDDNLFALCGDGSVIYWEVKDFNDLKLIKPQYYSPTPRVEIMNILHVLFRQVHSLYMVASGRDLLMVLRFKDKCSKSNDYSDDSDDSYDEDDDIFYKTIGFQVFKLEPEDKRWVKIDDFGEVALFVGGSSSMCVSVEYAQGLQRNCIYFTDDEYELWELPKEHGGHDMGVYDNKDDKIWPFYKGEDMHSLFCPPIFFIPEF
ncbi:F-box/kelch-repeat protein KIB1-like [Silene latifolia]|uniref:F-box/kelch-repeat protein KIB1-like n=1 Tax=Silene latifolia TaxID=37657 RepID=UPI003D7771E4